MLPILRWHPQALASFSACDLLGSGQHVELLLWGMSFRSNKPVFLVLFHFSPPCAQHWSFCLMSVVTYGITLGLPRESGSS